MISKVNTVEFKNEWASKYGPMYSFTYEMEDGTILEANHKANKGFEVGTEVEYEVTKDDEYGKKGKVGKPQEEGKTYPQSTQGAPRAVSNGVDVQLLIVKQSSLKAAIDYSAVHGGSGTKEILDVADIFVKWVMEGSKPMAEPTKLPHMEKIDIPVASLEDSDKETEQATAHLNDLPF
ncbi:MAG: hypothetical protein QQN63_02880 [Nitrosopumilus sp.]